MRRVILPSLLLVLLAPAAALGGGFATAGLSSTPDDVRPGEPWNVDVTILQHGRTPMTDLKPAVIVKNAAGKSTRFVAKPTAEPGVYRASVRFPDAGRYTYTVDDGFTNAVAHEFPPVDIKAAGDAAVSGTVAADDSPVWPFLLGALLAVVLAAGAVVMLRRRSGPQPA